MIQEFIRKSQRPPGQDTEKNVEKIKKAWLVRENEK